MSLKWFTVNETMLKMIADPRWDIVRQHLGLWESKLLWYGKVYQPNKAQRKFTDILAGRRLLLLFNSSNPTPIPLPPPPVCKHVLKTFTQPGASGLANVQTPSFSFLKWFNLTNLVQLFRTCRHPFFTFTYLRWESGHFLGAKSEGRHAADVF